ncbi:hypothetical protein [Bacillus bombysepticus]|uniref:hypothetical protein n=1 Tax=Bacillus bombysepticus TaxID=658666 RepID=UPI003015976A
MTSTQIERINALILEIQQGAVDWDLQKIKTILGGKYSKKSPELYNDMLELLNNGYVTVTVDKINYASKESLVEAQGHPDYIEMFRHLNFNLSEFGLLLDFSICKWLIQRGELPHEIYSPNTLAHLKTANSNFSVKIGNADIFQMLYFLFPQYKCHVHVVYTSKEIKLFQFERTKEYIEWKCKKDEEFSNSFSEQAENFFAMHFPPAD